jgi:hypothetical protein
LGGAGNICRAGRRSGEFRCRVGDARRWASPVAQAMSVAGKVMFWPTLSTECACPFPRHSASVSRTENAGRWSPTASGVRLANMSKGPKSSDEGECPDAAIQRKSRTRLATDSTENGAPVARVSRRSGSRPKLPMIRMEVCSPSGSCFVGSQAPPGPTLLLRVDTSMAPGVADSWTCVASASETQKTNFSAN